MTGPAAQAQGCPDIGVVFARGTDEPVGLGRVGSAFVASLSGSRSIDLCNVGDPVCSQGDDIAAHSNYGPAGFADQAAAFVAGRL